MNILVSTCAFDHLNLSKALKIAYQHDIILEFSSGIQYSPHLEELYVNLNCERYLHNYFPPPKEPFVINLASTNPEIRRKSINHCIRGLDLAKISGSKFFAAHSGFCIDINPKILGKPFPKKEDYERIHNMDLFLNSLDEILSYARLINIYFCIENNVVADFNKFPQGSNPFLCANPEEINYVLEEMNNNYLYVLLDTGHLKVSALTLNFDLDSAVRKIMSKILVIHHSDNDGYEDTNSLIGEDYWFSSYFDHISRDVFHILEVKNLEVSQILSQLNLLRSMIDST